jgi:NADH:ubiquinone oxidoreductase subunit 5 (chain L)/Multisubunit Na+/H+ antiporter, MnhA subunit
MSTLIGLSILFPILTGFVCLGLKNHKARAGIVILTAIVLIVTSLLFLKQGSFPIKYSPAPAWDWVILIFDYVILAFFLFVAIKDFVQRGISRHNVLAIALTLATGIPLAIFEFSRAGELPIEIAPTLFVDHLSIVMCLIISIIGSLIAVYAIRYMKDHEEHRMHLGDLKETNQPRFFFLTLIFLGAMNGLVFANNMLWLAFFWEMTTLCCYALIRHDETPIAITNAFRAMWMCLIGGVGFTLAIIFSWYGPLHTISLMTIINSGAVAYPALFCLLPCCVWLASPSQPRFPSRAGCSEPWLPPRPFPLYSTPALWLRLGCTLYCA